MVKKKERKNGSSSSTCECESLRPVIEQLKNEIIELKSKLDVLIASQEKKEKTSWAEITSAKPDPTQLHCSKEKDERPSTKLVIKEPFESVVSKLKKDKDCLKNSKLTSTMQSTTVQVNNGNLNKVKSCLNKSKITYKEVQKRLPVIKLGRIPHWVTKESLHDSLLRDNVDIFTTEEDISNVYLYPTKSPKAQKSASVRISPNSFKRLVEIGGSLTIESMLRIDAYPDIKPSRCMQCGNMGHSKKTCQDQDETPTCFHCGTKHEQHLGRDCEKAKNGGTSCAACSISQQFSQNANTHHTFDGCCPIFQIHLRRLIEDTDFGMKNTSFLNGIVENLKTKRFKYAN